MITITKDGIEINSLTVESPELATQLKALPKPEQLPYLKSCILIGSQVLERTHKAADLDWFKRSMLEHGGKFQLLLDKHLEKLIAKFHSDLDPENKKGSLMPLVDSVRSVKKELDARIEKTAKEFEKNQKALDETLKDNFDLDSKSSSMSQFQRSVTDTLTRFEKSIDPNQRGTLLGDFTDKLDSLFEDRLSLGDKSSLGIFKKELTQALSELRGEVRSVLAAQEVTQRIQAKLPGKGVEFEAEALAIASHLAQARNDVAESCGSSPGKGTSKRGDLIYVESLTGSKIVIECKNQESTFSTAKIIDAVETAIENRNAEFAIFLVKDRKCLPETFGSLHVSERFIACTLDLFEAALKMTLIRLQTERLRVQGQEIDFPTIVRSIQSAIRDVETLDSLSTTCSTAERGIGKVRDGLESVRDSIRRNLGTAEAALAGASPTSVPHSAGSSTRLN